MVFRLGPDHLWADDIADAIGDEKNRRHETLLGVAGNVACTESHREAHRRTEESNEGVPNHRGRWSMPPCRLPDDDKAGDDRQAAQDEDGNAQVAMTRAEPASESNPNGRDGAQRKLE